MSSLNAISYPAIQADTQLASHNPRDHFQRTGHIVIAGTSLLLALGTAQECQSVAHIPSLLFGVILWGWWGLVAAVLWKTAPRRSAIMRLSFAGMGTQLALAILLATIHLILLSSLNILIPEWRKPVPTLTALTAMLQINRIGLDILIYGFVFGLVGTIQSQIRAQRESISALELQRQLSAAQLKALQMQLEPHFLFNTLNAITTLVELGKQSQAAEMLNHLNAILKTTLERRTPEKVRLSQELEIVDNYLAIEQVRFADRLRVDIKVDPSALHSLVPCFLLQPIVENAIRHGIAHCEDEGIIEASAKREGNRLHISVRNHGSISSAQSKPGNGIGLKNTQERLAYFYPHEHHMSAGPLTSGGYEVTIDVPYERAV